MNKKITYSIIVPIYNAQVCIELLASKLIASLDNMASTYEVIFVDDASSDNSWEICKQLKALYPDKIKAILLSRNFGQHNATLCGISHAKGNYILTIDDDLEFDPAQIPLLVEKMASGNYQIVYGIGKDSKSILRKVLTFIVKKTVQLVNGKQSAKGSSFRLIKGELATKILQQTQCFTMIDEFLTWYTKRIGYVQVQRSKSAKQTSSYSIWALSKSVIETILFSSSIPLNLLKNLGFLMIFFNVIWALFILYRKVFHSISVEGYTSLIIAILFSTGFIILGLTIIAEYLRKAILVAYKKPSFNEDEVL